MCWPIIETHVVTRHIRSVITVRLTLLYVCHYSDHQRKGVVSQRLVQWSNWTWNAISPELLRFHLIRALPLDVLILLVIGGRGLSLPLKMMLLLTSEVWAPWPRAPSHYDDKGERAFLHPFIPVRHNEALINYSTCRRLCGLNRSSTTAGQRSVFSSVLGYRRWSWSGSGWWGTWGVC